MGDGPRYNLKSPSVKRLMQEAKELREATEQYHAQPLDDNLYEWHFTIRGAPDTDFADGVYHGRIMLPPDYPMKPPSIVLLTPTGRFEINKKICLSISGHHPESWQPSWSIRTALMAIIGFLPSPGKGAIGALDYPSEERKKLAKRSKDWKCPVCGVENHLLLRTPEASSAETNGILQEVKDLARKISFKGESPSETSASPKSNNRKIVSKSLDSSLTAETEVDPAYANENCQPDPKPPISDLKSADDDVAIVEATALTEAANVSTEVASDPVRESSRTPPPEPLTPAFPVDDGSSPNASSTASTLPNASDEDASVLRQRARRLEDVADREIAAREASAAVREATPVRPELTARNQAQSTTSSYLMILLSIAIGVLLLRRILRSVDFQFDFQFDYNFDRR